MSSCQYGEQRAAPYRAEREGRNPDAEHLSTSELKGWVKKTLELTSSL
jgi:hypothetical protein